MTPRSLAKRPEIHHWDFPGDAAAEAVYLPLLEELQKHFIDIQRDDLSLTAFDAFVQKVEQGFEVDPWALFRVFHDGRAYTPSTASACLNTALVASLYAQQNGWSTDDRHVLVRAALLHDVGMLFLPPEVLRKPGKLTERERELLEAHPSASYERVRRWGEPFESTQIALQHHEEWQGQGYPAHLVGEAIHPWSRVMAVCIQFVARVTQRRYRDSLVGYEALKLLIKDQGVRFDPVAVRGLVQTLGLQPPGAILLLSDGSVARVIEVTQGNALRPVVRLLVDAFGTVFRDDKGPIVNLVDAPKLFVVRPIHLHDLMQARDLQANG